MINSPIINVMTAAAHKAARSLIRDYGEVQNLQVSVKGPGDFVSAADLKAEKILIYELNKARPDFTILSEERGTIIGKDESARWVIDPLDGTTNFLHGIPHFAISIALKSYNEIVSGVIYDPIKDEMFYAEKNNGAYFNNQRIKVSKKKNLENCLFATGSDNNEKNKTKKNIKIRNFGSAALDMAYVGAGRLDGFFEKNLNIWDIAAGIIIIKEAGGIINDIDINKNKNIKVLASSSSINEKFAQNLLNF